MTRYICIVILLILFVGCKRPVQFPEGRESAPPSNDEGRLININRYLVIRQQEIISAYVKRMGWDMQKTSTGLWYMIYEKGDGKKAEKGNVISLDYRISLLDGSICDQSDPNSPKSFRIGHGGVEPGLEEGALLLREGDEARLIMVPHLAHGNFGDRQKIPAGEILMYELKVKSIR